MLTPADRASDGLAEGVNSLAALICRMAWDSLEADMAMIKVVLSPLALRSMINDQ